MENSLVLAHLPQSLAFSEQLEFIKKRPQAPEPAEIADVLCRSGADARLVWEAIDIARRLASITESRLGRALSAASYWSDQYPVSLRGIPDAPWNLFYRGELPATEPILAIVGSRNPNDYGIRLVSEFVTRLQTRPIQIVSGLAYGIDALAHHYACASKIRNFAIMGSGADIVYPHAHAHLAERILEGGGGVISELPPGTEPAPRHFPRRNRIISGLAEVVWVVQGTALSGSYHTAKHAMDQGRTVAACPGDIFTELSQIPNRLLFEGAQTILRPHDIDLLIGKWAGFASDAAEPQRQLLPKDV